MSKLMNQSQDFVTESLRGILKAHSRIYTCANGNVRALHLQKAAPGKVSIVTGGGYGHLPLFLGYVGEGLCDGAAVGNVFTSPSCETILDVSRAVANDAGILYLFGHYFGDCMNFEMAAEIMASEGVKTKCFMASDDLASAPREAWRERRGIAGIAFLYKIAGAAAQAGATLEEVHELVAETAERISSFGVSFSSCTLPGARQPIFEIRDGEMEIGMGIHGEPGLKREKLFTSQELARIMTERLYEEGTLAAGKQIALLLNGLGATSREELYLFYNDLETCFSQKGVSIAKPYVGEYVTSMEMSGVSVSVLPLNERLSQYMEAGACAPMLHML
ncbi:MAG: dihydroxyacetone kinase subunit DhaK [Clostridiales bacterium]|nr:dihydroxyacetone kinase subunit DhaK [Clostridiales bacterium]MDO4349632.1 dihydroxyacetone kinase subunit DhaK [Eubacteriales bacterium]MDY4009266.1 dihydroxyacetone kinase subunit DhaK [Candidatus Limiplasma sp.]